VELPALRREGWIGRGGVDLYWQAWLPSAPPVAKVVLCHGIAEHGGRYPHAVGQLVAAGYGVFALDARGHGRSGGRRGSFDRFAQLVADLETLVEHIVALAPTEALYLMGYSLGGAVALTYALEHQDDLAGLVIVGSALGRGAGISWLQFEAASLLSTLAPRCPLIRLRAAQMTQDGDVARDYDNDPLVHHRRLNARTIGEIAAVMRNLPKDFPRLRAPLLLLHGAADVTASPEGSRALLAGAGSTDKALRIYDRRRHDLLNEPGHEEVMADVVGWLDARCRDPL
jgi:acylglycerol lipase